MKGIITILKKELKKFFTDKRMIISLLLPAILIYALYSFMGSMLNDMLTTNEDYCYQIATIEAPTEYDSIIKTDAYEIEFHTIDLDAAKQKLENKEIDLIISFADFAKTNNVDIMYNSSSTESTTIYNYYYSAFMTDATTIQYNYFINTNQNLQYDLATNEDSSAMFIKMLVPFLLIMLLFSGCMAISVESIAGEKERGTIATLLVTPVRRMDIAIGKVVALSITALFSSFFSFLAVILSYPKLMEGNNVTISMYGFAEYAQILAIIVVTVLLFTILLTIISCYAKTIKEASGLAMPIMILVMIVGVTSMLGLSGDNLALYLIPVFNSVQALTNIFGLTSNVTGFVITIVSNIVYFVACVFGLTRMFNSEKVMFNS